MQYQISTKNVLQLFLGAQQTNIYMDCIFLSTTGWVIGNALTVPPMSMSTTTAHLIPTIPCHTMPYYSIPQNTTVQTYITLLFVFIAAQSKEAGIRTLVALDDQGGELPNRPRLPFHTFPTSYTPTPTSTVNYLQVKLYIRKQKCSDNIVEINNNYLTTCLFQLFQCIHTQFLQLITL